MGLIKAGIGALGGTLADQWKEFFYCESMPKEVLVTKGQKRVSGRSSNTKGSDNIISNGSGIALDDGLVQYLTQVLRDRDWAGFYKLSQITTKMDLNPEEFLFWLGNKELWADDEERACAAVISSIYCMQ